MRRILPILLLVLLLSGCAMGRLAPTPTPEPTPCPHPAWEAGVCTECGAVCEHPSWEAGACAVCGLACEHPAWEAGLCTVCGLACRHPDWKDGVCTVCGTVCEHPIHDPKARKCTVCGQRVFHEFIGGVCACGATPLVYDYVLPDRFYEECEHPGTIETWEYQNAVPGWAEYTRHLMIYLPYGYDPGEQYDLLILLHGTGDDETAWLTYPHYVPDREGVQVRTIFDRMIEEEIIRPVIIVTLCLYEDFGAYVGDPTEARLAEELRDFILPHLIETYATYAAEPTLEAVEAARQHFALGGLSWGSYFTYACGMRLNLPYFGNFICLSGSDNPDLVLSYINSPELIDYPIYLYYSAAGTTDMAHNAGIINFQQLVLYTDRLIEGQNAFLHETEGGHAWNVWSTEIFNALQLAFHPEKK